MSGRKLTPMEIMQQHMQQLMRQVHSSQEAQQDAAREIHRVRQQMHSEMASALQAQEHRNQQLANQTRQEMHQIEQNMQQQISGVWSAMQEGFQSAYERDEQLQRNIEQVQQESLERDRQLQRNIDNVQVEMRRGQQVLQNQINTIEGRHTNATEAARTWCEEAGRIVGHIRDNLRHDKFTPGALARIEQELQMAETNLKTPGTENAALANAQGAYLKAQQLRLQIEAAEAEWQARVNAAKGLALQLEAEWDVNRKARFQFDTENGPQELEGSVDDWTGGEYGKVKEQIEAVRRQLEQPENLTLDQVKELERQLGVLQQEHVRVVNLARQAIIASQLRADMATIVAEALQQQGWEVIDSAYEGEEQTNSLHVKLKSGQDEMVITYTPEQTEETVTNSVDTAFFDRVANDEAFRRSRLAAIENALRSIEGIECGESQCVPGTENSPCRDQARLDFEQIRRQKRQRQPAQSATRARTQAQGRTA